MIFSKTRFLLLSLSLLLSLPSNAQFAPELVATWHYGSTGELSWAGDDDFVFLKGGELHHLQMQGQDGYTVQEVPNALSDAYQTVVFDVDQDGDLDAHCYNYNSGKVRTYLKEQGAYTYAPDVQISTNTPFFLYPQDFNEDGMTDFFLNNRLYLATGPFSYTDSFYTSGGSPIYKYMHFVDMDGDGDKDIFTHISNNLKTLVNTGSSALESKSVLDFEEDANWARVIYTNGQPVVIYQNKSSWEICRLEFNGSNYTYTVLLDADQLYRNPVVADFNGDGREEIVAYQALDLIRLEYDAQADTLAWQTFSYEDYIEGLGVWPADSMTWLLLSHDRGLHAYAAVNADSLEPDFQIFQGIGLGDFMDLDGDGYTDIVDFLGFADGYEVKRYLGDFQFEKTVRLNFPVNGGEFRDFDDDGDLDLVQDNAWYEQTGTLVFDDSKPKLPDTLPYPDPQILFTKIALVDDLDLDGDLDIVSYNAFGEDVMIHENINNQYFEDGFTIAVWQDISGDLRYIEALDLDGDGDKDLLMAADAAMVWFETQGPLQFSAANNLHGLPYEPRHVDIADINQDNYPDILMSTYYNTAGNTTGFVELFLGSEEGPSSFATIHSGEGAHKSSFADINGDLRPDIVYVYDNAMYWVEMLPDNSFEQTFIDGSFGINNFFRAEDVDSDGDTDLITWCGTCYAPIPNQDNRISYYINTGDTSNLFPCPAGNVYLENQQELDEFGQLYPHCPVIEGDLYIGKINGGWADVQSLEPLSNIVEVKGNLTFQQLNQITDFQGMQKLESVGGLSINGFKGESLHGLHKLAHIGGNFRLRNIFTGFPMGGTLDSLRSLEYIGGDIDFSFSSIESTTLPALEQDTLYGDVTFRRLALGETDIELLRSVRHISGTLTIEDNNLPSLSPLGNLTEIGQDFLLNNNNDPSFFVIALTDLNDSLVVGNFWQMVQNPRLWYCGVPPVCNHLPSGKPFAISNPNSFQCASLRDIICPANRFSGMVYFDENQNGLYDAGEAPLGGIPLQSKQRIPFLPDTLYTQADGHYFELYAPEDSVEIKILVPEGWSLTSGIDTWQGVFSLNDPLNAGNDFGLFPDFEQHELSAGMTSTHLVCAQPFKIHLLIENRGTFAESGQAALSYPEGVELAPAYQAFTGHDPDNRLITWNYDELPAFQKQSFEPVFLPPSGDLEGEVLDFTLALFRDSAGVPLSEAMLSWSEELSCESPFQEKEVAPLSAEGQSVVAPGGELTYTIRFQNPWDEPITNLVLTDELPAELDPTTLELVATSHEATVLLEGQQLRFIFFDLNLPDTATDFAGSQGFVRFRIRLRPNVPPQTQFINEARLTFDQKSTRWTNEVVTTVETLTSTEEISADRRLVVYPQPADGSFTVEWSGLRACTYILYNLHGRPLQNGDFRHKAVIDAQALPSGVYVLSVAERDRGEVVEVRRIVIQ